MKSGITLSRIGLTSMTAFLVVLFISEPPITTLAKNYQPFYFNSNAKSVPNMQIDKENENLIDSLIKIKTILHKVNTSVERNVLVVENQQQLLKNY